MRISLMRQICWGLKHLGYDYFYSKLRVWKIIWAVKTDIRQESKLCYFQVTASVRISNVKLFVMVGAVQ